MSAAMPTEVRLTAEEFGRRPDPGHPEELVRGGIVPLTFHGMQHGLICTEVICAFGNYLEGDDLGRACVGSGVVTERNPDTVRGPDSSFYSYHRLPRGAVPVGYPEAAPDLIVEVRESGERWPKLLEKVAEYLNAGVSVVCVLDPDARTAQVFDAERPVRVVGEGNELTFPEVLPGFAVPVRRFFG